jgi:hypothetical protein
VKDENGNLLADSHNILNRRKNCFSQLLNVHNVSDIRQIEVHTVHQIFIDCKKAYDSVRREVLYNIFIEFEVPMKLVRLIKMCLN